MKKNSSLIILFLLIVIYFSISLFTKTNKILIYSNSIYLINDRKLIDYNYEKLNNKKFNILLKNNEVSTSYFKILNDGNAKFSLYDVSNKDIGSGNYYYAYTGEIKKSNFKEKSYLSSEETKEIDEVLKENGINIDFSLLNYVKSISISSGEQLFFIGNFNNDNYYSSMSLPDKEICFEYIIKRDVNKNYDLIYEKEVSGSDILDTKFLYFDCIMNLFEDDSYQIGVQAVIYSFHEVVPGSIYEIINNDFVPIDEKEN